MENAGYSAKSKSFTSGVKSIAVDVEAFVTNPRDPLKGPKVLPNSLSPKINSLNNLLAEWPRQSSVAVTEIRKREHPLVPIMTSSKVSGLDNEKLHNLKNNLNSITPGSLSRYASKEGVYTLANRNLIPKDRSMSPAFRSKKYLLSAKANIMSRNNEKAVVRGVKVERLRRPSLRPPKLLNPLPTHCHKSLEKISQEDVKFMDLPVQCNVIDQPGWVFYIQHGQVETEMMPFRRFIEKVTELEIQHIASYYIGELVKLANNYTIPLIVANCESIITRCLNPCIFIPLSKSEILDLIFNQKRVFELINKPGRMFLNGAIGLNEAAPRLNMQAKQFEMKQEEYVKSKDWGLISESTVLICLCPQEKEVSLYNHLQRAYHLALHKNLKMILVMDSYPRNLKEKLRQVFEYKLAQTLAESGRLQIVVTEISSYLAPNSIAAFALYSSTQAIKTLKNYCEGLKPLLIADDLTEYVAAVCDMLDCSFFGSSYNVACSINNDSTLLYKWIKEEHVPTLPVVAIDRSYSSVEIMRKAKEIQEVYKDVRSWIFRPKDSYGHNIRGSKLCDYLVNLDEPTGISLCGGQLHGIYQTQEASLIQIGLKIFNNGKHEILATTSTTIMDMEEYGTTIPHQRPRNDEFMQIIFKVITALRKNSFCGFATLAFLSWNGNIESANLSIQLLTITASLSNAILLALSLQTKNGLVMNQSTLELELEGSTPWALSFITKNQYLDTGRITKEFESVAPQFKSKTMFVMDRLKHDIFDHVSRALIAFSIQARITPFDMWSVRGVEFPIVEDSFPVICYGESEARVLEFYLVCLAQIENFTENDEDILNFSHNMHKLAFSVLKQLQAAKKNGSEQYPAISDPEILDRRQTVQTILKPFVGEHQDFPHPKIMLETVKEEEEKKSIISIDTIKLVNENIYSVLALEKDPTLFSDIEIDKSDNDKAEKANSESRANLLVAKLEVLHPTLTAKAFIQKKWAKL